MFWNLLKFALLYMLTLQTRLFSCIQNKQMSNVVFLLNSLSLCCKSINNAFHLEFLRIQNVLGELLLSVDEVIQLSMYYYQAVAQASGSLIKTVYEFCYSDDISATFFINVLSANDFGVILSLLFIIQMLNQFILLLIVLM